MAEIFLAREMGGPPEELLVVKRLLPHVSQHPDLVQMFLDEARVATTLEHPNVVKIYNVGAVDDQYFLSMEYLRGVDLANMCNRLWRQGRTLPLELSLFVVASVANALNYAHTKKAADGKPLQIVHRDVSPHNIFVTAEGEVKLLDFGVAKAANALHHTKTGALVGKVAYMSPEQCRVESIDCRSDLFSLGVVTYELTTGRRLYNTKKLGDFEVLRRICEDPVQRPTDLTDTYPTLVEQVVLRALAKDRAHRFLSAKEFERTVYTAARFMGFQLSRDMMGEFLQAEFPKALDEAEANYKLLKRAQNEEPGRISGSLPRLEDTPSGANRMPSPSLPPAPETAAGFVQIEARGDGEVAQETGSGELFDSEEDRTQPRRAPGTGTVKWKEIPKVTVNEDLMRGPTLREFFGGRTLWVLGAVLVLGTLVAAIAIVLN